MKRRKLVIISHTEHFVKGGEIVGWGPTVNEINFLAGHWDEVVHVACLHDTEAPASAVRYSNPNTRFVPIAPTGGATFLAKLGVLRGMRDVLRTVSQAIDGASHVQFRAPTGIGVFLLPVFSFFYKRKFVFWTKYAGDWGRGNAPLGSRFQRWWLTKNFGRCRVTINGRWPAQPEHCISFANPCLTARDTSRGKAIAANKDFSPPFRLAFVGRLEKEKGLDRIIDALLSVDPEQVEVVDIVGDGPQKQEYEEKCAPIAARIRFHGFLDGQGVHKILAGAHFLLLPSYSEGFPKVVAEAGCYGCIPVVSDVGSIGHYIRNSMNGFLWSSHDGQTYSEILGKALSTGPQELKSLSLNANQLAEAFTFEKFFLKLDAAILSSPERVKDRDVTRSLPTRVLKFWS